ncbi:MAG: hypothetical protein WCI11_14390 [Candidatus Methylumidiphilus sp.]
MDRRNLGSMDGGASGHPRNLDTGNPCRYDGCVNSIASDGALEASMQSGFRRSMPE